MSWAGFGIFMGGVAAGASTVALSWALTTIGRQEARIADLTEGGKEVVAQAERQFETARISEREHEARENIAGKCIIDPGDPLYPLLHDQISDFRARDFGRGEGGK